MRRAVIQLSKSNSRNCSSSIIKMNNSIGMNNFLLPTTITSCSMNNQHQLFKLITLSSFNYHQSLYHSNNNLNNNNLNNDENNLNNNLNNDENKFSRDELQEILNQVEEQVYSHKLFNQVLNLPNQPEENLFLKWNSITQIVNQSYYKVLKQKYPQIYSIDEKLQDEGEISNQITLKVVLFKNELYKYQDLNIFNFIKRILINFGLNEFNNIKSTIESSPSLQLNNIEKLSDENIKEIYKNTFLTINDDELNNSIYYQELKAIGQSGPNDLYQRNELTKPIIARAQYEVITKYFENNYLLHWLQYRLSLEEWYHRLGSKDQEIIDRTREFHNWQLDIIVGREEKTKNSKKFKKFVAILFALTVGIVAIAYIGLGGNKDKKENEN
ncbi:hypothetical protein NAEGRDRAFT_81148 [Naegleria gruberi]|uniref:Uncharacterized protein n=1 Tax=Naegleria gruberi TaxID=5762 RepID=D2VT82_NAEGR|nr:uncharacterized protein NAEGRDRAFT_81148 [Naegleria gruberi]EFC40102.1 hypothetical protein NAEGRDRAFT_81148 [Naegleria gruberi]|eukprot:XP_002672846.1 hypothetical protein NAEGRDRAFT_81148 [Naegleria gruberi strain NEG-M]